MKRGKTVAKRNSILKYPLCDDSVWTSPSLQLYSLSGKRKCTWSVCGYLTLTQPCPGISFVCWLFNQRMKTSKYAGAHWKLFVIFLCHCEIRIKMKLSCCKFPLIHFTCLYPYKRCLPALPLYHILRMIEYVLVTNLIFLTGLLLILGLRVIPVWCLVVCLKLENNTTSGKTLGKCFVLWEKNAWVTQSVCSWEVHFWIFIAFLPLLPHFIKNTVNVIANLPLFFLSPWRIKPLVMAMIIAEYNHFQVAKHDSKMRQTMTHRLCQTHDYFFRKQCQSIFWAPLSLWIIQVQLGFFFFI